MKERVLGADIFEPLLVSTVWTPVQPTSAAESRTHY